MIERVTQHKDLGVLFDEHFAFVPHIKFIIPKANIATAQNMRLAKGIRSKAMMVNVFTIYIQPIIEYASVIWRSGQISLIKLDTSLRTATRQTVHGYILLTSHG